VTAIRGRQISGIQIKDESERLLGSS